MLWQILSQLGRILQALSRLERATAPPGPQGLNRDAWLGLRPQSAAAYQALIGEFTTWCSRHRLDLDYPTEIDRAVVAFAQDTKLSRGRLETLCSALKRALPSLRGQLVWADMHLKHLLRYAPPAHKVPMLRHVYLVVGHTLALHGWARAGGLLILQGSTGLRPGEVLSLCREDLVPGRPGVNAGNAVIALGRRTGTKVGRAQFVIVHAAEDPVALALVAAFASTTKPGQRLTSLNYTVYKKLLDQTLAHMGFADLGFTPHSPRAGWATHLRLTGMPFTEIQERGRWASASTLRAYLDAVAASTALLQRTQVLQPFATWLEEDFAERFLWWR